MAYDEDGSIPVDVKDIPTIINDSDTYHLIELVNSDFGMSTIDKDFMLSHEQMIKVCKVLLYKINMLVKRGKLEKEEYSIMISKKMKQIQDATTSQVNEINVFLHQVHNDFEAFMNKHQMDHTSLNERLLKMNQDTSNLSNNVTNSKIALD